MKDQTYEIEEMFLSKFATKSKDTKGRVTFEEPCPMRTMFQRDRDRIIHSKSFRRLKNKTQVFLKPEGDHFRTRMTHTLDVCQIARTLARILYINEDLTEAIALGHDLGHTPFGHAGERALKHLTNNFSHAEQGVRVVEILEHDGKGLNLTYEVCDGILNHTASGHPATLEGRIVHLADRIAYLNHDLDDAFRAKVISQNDLPLNVRNVLGDTHSKRINTMITSIYRQSFDKSIVDYEPEIKNAAEEFYHFMFNKVYLTQVKRNEEEKVEHMIELLFKYYKKDISRLPEFYVNLSEKYSEETVICDYISTMTDGFLLHVFNKAYIPRQFV